VLDWQIGDSFDFAIVLCSLLIGVGYNAYVVYGTAPKKITTRDESMENVPFDTTFRIDGDLDELEAQDPNYDKDEELMISKVIPETDSTLNFDVKIAAPHRSVYDDERKAEEETKTREKKRKAVTIDDDEPDYEKEDAFGKTRLHAWVFVQA
jgi:hypothetical protein